MSDLRDRLAAVIEETICGHWVNGFGVTVADAVIRELKISQETDWGTNYPTVPTKSIEYVRYVTDWKPVSRYQRGDPVTVEFMGIECPGEVLRHSSGYVMAQVTIPDMEVDFGSISPRLDPQPTVCVPEARVRRRDTPQSEKNTNV